MPGGLPLQEFYGGRTLNIAHRGASYDAPANTLAAFELAATYGADGVELDTMLTADGHPVVIHDGTVDATTDGSGSVADMTLVQIKALDAGSYKDPQYAGERIPTLTEVFSAIGDRLLINIELKGMSYRRDGLEATVAELIDQHHLSSRVIVSSFNPVRLRRMRRAAPHVPIGFLHMRDGPLFLRWAWLLWPFTREADHPIHTQVSQKYLAWARRHRLRVNTWVVNDPARMAVLRDLGVDMIMTDRPNVLRAVLLGER